jgi:hypothetical protein
VPDSFVIAQACVPCITQNNKHARRLLIASVEPSTVAVTEPFANEYGGASNSSSDAMIVWTNGGEKRKAERALSAFEPREVKKGEPQQHCLTQLFER